MIWGVVCNALLGDRFSVFWPFHKDPIHRTLFHFVMGETFKPFFLIMSLVVTEAYLVATALTVP